MTHAIDVSDLPEPLVEAIESLVKTYREKSSSAGAPVEPRPIGWLKGRWELPETFFEPPPMTCSICSMVAGNDRETSA